MPAKIRQFRLPGPIDEAVDVRVEQLGYKSVSAYFLGLVRYDLSAMTPHHVSIRWANLTDSEQRALNEELLENAKKGEGQRGVLLHHIIEREIEKKLGKKLSVDSKPSIQTEQSTPEPSSDV